MAIADKLQIVAENQQKVYEAGKKAEYDAFWDAIQNYGSRVYYQMGFAYWNCEYIRPKYKAVATDKSGLNQTFMYNNSLKKIEAEYFDFSQKPIATSHGYSNYYTFLSCVALEEIEDIGIHETYSYYATFQNCKKLHTIAVLRVTENTLFNDAFLYCYNLVNLTIDGVIGQNYFNVKDSTKLSKASITSIINALSTTTSGLTVTLSQTAVNAAFTTDEWNALVATKTNWTISLV